MKFITAVCLFLLPVVGSPTVARAACETPMQALDEAIAAGSEARIDHAMVDIQSSMECDGSDVGKARSIVSDWLVPSPSEPNKISSLNDEQKRRLDKAYGLHSDWRVSILFGDVALADGNCRGAAEAYLDAIRQIDSMDRQSAADTTSAGAIPSQGELAQLTLKIDEARHLAASGPNPVLVATIHERDGSIGGVYSPALNRGPVALHVPVPILFEYDSTAFTQLGKQATDELIELFKQRRPSEIAIVGHTDRVGSDTYNKDLSLRRARAVAQILIDQGIQAHIVVAGMGKSEPRRISDASRYTQDQIDQLNRLVEFSWK